MDWPETATLLAAITPAGPVRFVGGCVRDWLAGRSVIEADLATPLAPEAVAEALAGAGLKAIPTGVAHGTLTALVGKRSFEITTLRRDVETDGRHAVIAPTEDWAEDAARRDFTINALYWDPLEGTLFDPFDGQADLAAGRVRFIGEAEARIREDVLRILRFFRFSSLFARAGLDPEGLAACRAAAPLLAGLSAERVQGETLKLLAGPAPAAIWAAMAEAGALVPWLVEACNTDRLAAWQRAAPSPAGEALLKLALLIDRTEDAAGLGARLKLSGASQQRLCAAFPAMPLPATDPDLRVSVHRLGKQALADRFCRWAAENGVQPADVAEALARLEALEVPPFPLRGRDLLERGHPPGRAVGKMLESLKERWMAAGASADRATCLGWLEEARFD